MIGTLYAAGEGGGRAEEERTWKKMSTEERKEPPLAAVTDPQMGIFVLVEASLSTMQWRGSCMSMRGRSQGAMIQGVRQPSVLGG